MGVAPESTVLAVVARKDEATCAADCAAVFAGVTDADRAAPLVRETALDLHLNLQTGDTSARAKLTVQNGTAAPLTRIVLQISSSLQWQSARLVLSSGGSVALELQQHRVATDADHTGAATEMAVTLPQPLLPGKIANLDVFYGGVLGSSAQRLLRLGAPAERAALSDWDTVSDRFTGLRGFGNVLWMPVAAPVALLATGAEFGQVVDAQRMRNEGSGMRLRLTVETAGPAPGTAFLLGADRPLAEVATSGDAPNAAVSAPATGVSSASGVMSSSAVKEMSPGENDVAADAGSTPEETRLYTAEWPRRIVGAEFPSLFSTAAPQRTSALVRVATEDVAAAEAYQAAAARVRPMLEEWLTARPARLLQIVDVPLPGAQPFAADDLLVTPLQAEDAKLLAPALAYPLAAAWLPANVTPWLAEGLPEFLRTLYLERTIGRASALSSAGNAVALARAEAGTPARQPAVVTGVSSSTDAVGPAAAMPPLAECVEADCARIKGAYVLGMLRQIAGDAALKQAISGWIGSRGSGTGETDTSMFERLVEAAAGKDLQWFFADWIDRDAGLPDLAIVNVAPRRIERGTVTNTVPTQRRPVGGPIGPEVVPQADRAEQESTTMASRNRIASADGSWLIAVEVQNNGGAAAEVPVTVRGSGLQNTLSLRVAAHSRATIRVPFETAPEEVTVNDGTTPEQRTSNHRRTISLPAAMR